MGEGAGQFVLGGKACSCDPPRRDTTKHFRYFDSDDTNGGGRRIGRPFASEMAPGEVVAQAFYPQLQLPRLELLQNTSFANQRTQQQNAHAFTESTHAGLAGIRTRHLDRIGGLKSPDLQKPSRVRSVEQRRSSYEVQSSSIFLFFSLSLLFLCNLFQEALSSARALFHYLMLPPSSGRVGSPGLYPRRQLFSRDRQERGNRYYSRNAQLRF